MAASAEYIARTESYFLNMGGVTYEVQRQGWALNTAPTTPDLYHTTSGQTLEEKLVQVNTFPYLIAEVYSASNKPGNRRYFVVQTPDMPLFFFTHGQAHHGNPHLTSFSCPRRIVNEHEVTEAVVRTKKLRALLDDPVPA